MTILLEASQVYKDFNIGQNRISVLKNVTFEIKKGEFVSIMGPSGSGKSTLLYLLGGLDYATKGSIKLKNITLSELPDEKISQIRRKELGFIFQFYNLVPNLNVEDNILLPLVFSREKKKNYKHKLEELLEITKLTNHRLHRPSELSGGQQQRVAISRALITNPDVILADEPIGNLDTHSGIRIMEMLRDINKEKEITIVQVTHSHRAAKYGNRLIELKDGEIINDELIMTSKEG